MSFHMTKEGNNPCHELHWMQKMPYYLHKSNLDGWALVSAEGCMEYFPQRLRQ